MAIKPKHNHHHQQHQHNKVQTPPQRKSTVDPKILESSVEEIRRRLSSFLERTSLVEQDLILPSGQIGHYYIDTKKTLYNSEAGILASLAILKTLKPEVTDVGGISSNATSLVTGTIQLAYLQNRKLNSFFVRKEPRKYGKSKWVEGPLEYGATVCMVEDVLLDGENIIKAIRKVQDEFGVTVVQVIALLDRFEGGRERLEDLGVEVTTICTIEDVFDANS